MLWTKRDRDARSSRPGALRAPASACPEPKGATRERYADQWCADCPHDVWQHEPTAACRVCEAKGSACSFRLLSLTNGNPFPRLTLFRWPSRKQEKK